MVEVKEILLSGMRSLSKYSVSSTGIMFNRMKLYFFKFSIQEMFKLLTLSIQMEFGFLDKYLMNEIFFKRYLIITGNL